MPRNVEIKARVGGLDAVAGRLRRLPVHDSFKLTQHDVFYRVPDGRLKLRTFDDNTSELIFYRRPDTTAPGVSTYERAPVADRAGLARLLAQAFGVRGEVRKERTVALVGQTRVHLDRVAGLGEFVELEVVLTDDQTEAEACVIADRLMEALGIGADDLVDAAYIDLLEGSIAGDSCT